MFSLLLTREISQRKANRQTGATGRKHKYARRCFPHESTANWRSILCGADSNYKLQMEHAIKVISIKRERERERNSLKILIINANKQTNVRN